jgi:hypothetical protein
MRGIHIAVLILGLGLACCSPQRGTAPWSALPAQSTLLRAPHSARRIGIVEYVVPARIGGPQAQITVDANGNPWFYNLGRSQGRVATALASFEGGHFVRHGVPWRKDISVSLGSELTAAPSFVYTYGGTQQVDCKPPSCSDANQVAQSFAYNVSGGIVFDTAYSDFQAIPFYEPHYDPVTHKVWASVNAVVNAEISIVEQNYPDGTGQKKSLSLGAGGSSGTMAFGTLPDEIYVVAALDPVPLVPKIYRISKSRGTIDAAFALPENVWPCRMVAGAVDALWFTDCNASAIFRMTRNGRFRRFATPTRSSQPMGIVLAADGAIWFTEYAASKVGRIDRSGAITEYRTPTKGAGPGDLATPMPETPAANQRVIWFTEAKAHRLAESFY